jgi:membrane associated rhomboid family serine protease
VIPFLLALDCLLSLVFLFPLKDDRGRYRAFPYMTLALVLLNTVIHVLVYHVLLLGEDAWSEGGLMRQVMLVPADILSGEGLGALSMITAAFLHANWPHLVGNMFILWFFGRKLEDMLGPTKFGLFYLVCVLVSGMGSVLGRTALPITQGMIPGLGASGAIMGIVAAYLFLYPQQRILTLMLFGIIPIPLRIPAWVFILYTVTRDILGGRLEQEFQAIGYLYSFVDSFAHLGGVIAGLMCVYFFLPRELLYYRHGPGATPGSRLLEES